MTDADQRPAVVGQVERPVRPLVERLRAGCTDWDGSQMAAEAPPMDCLTAGDVREAADEIERLRADLKAMEGFADLWYFVSDEAPLQFEKIVAEYSPGRWLGEAHKLRAAKRGA